MKTPFKFRAPSFDAQAINETIRGALAAAGLNTTAGPMLSMTDTIRRALSSSAMAPMGGVPAARGEVIDIVARVVEARQDAGVQPVPPARSSIDEPQLPAGTFDSFEIGRASCRERV